MSLQPDEKASRAVVWRPWFNSWVGNNFYGEPHWKLYCYWGRIYYICRLQLQFTLQNMI